MDERDQVVPERCPIESDAEMLSRGNSPDLPKGERTPSHVETETKQLKIVVRLAPAEAQPSPSSSAIASPESMSETAGRKRPVEAERETIPARMLNEFVYCQRLFYYEFVEGVFVENAD